MQMIGILLCWMVRSFLIGVAVIAEARAISQAGFVAGAERQHLRGSCRQRNEMYRSHNLDQAIREEHKEIGPEVLQVINRGKWQSWKKKCENSNRSWVKLLAQPMWKRRRLMTSKAGSISYPIFWRHVKDASLSPNRPDALKLSLKKLRKKE